ncbi:hypothetical protein EKE57_004651 [Escherichia coli]|nr:hypothetical protein [Escherichia coli]
MDNNLTPEQTQAGLDKIAKGDMPDSTNITKVIVDGYQDGVMIAGAGIGAGLGGAFGKYAPTAVGKILGNDPVPGFIYELGGGAVSEFTNGIIKDFNNPQAPEKKKINENFVELFNSPSVLLPVFYNSVTWSRFGCISVFFFQK